jgi:hypothetical protein
MSCQGPKYNRQHAEDAIKDIVDVLRSYGIDCFGSGLNKTEKETQEKQLRKLVHDMFLTQACEDF